MFNNKKPMNLIAKVLLLLTLAFQGGLLAGPPSTSEEVTELGKDARSNGPKCICAIPDVRRQIYQFLSRDDLRTLSEVSSEFNDEIESLPLLGDQTQQSETSRVPQEPNPEIAILPGDQPFSNLKRRIRFQTFSKTELPVSNAFDQLDGGQILLTQNNSFPTVLKRMCRLWWHKGILWNPPTIASDLEICGPDGIVKLDPMLEQRTDWPMILSPNGKYIAVSTPPNNRNQQGTTYILDANPKGLNCQLPPSPAVAFNPVGDEIFTMERLPNRDVLAETHEICAYNLSPKNPMEIKSRMTHFPPILGLDTRFIVLSNSKLAFGVDCRRWIGTPEERRDLLIQVLGFDSGNRDFIAAYAPSQLLDRRNNSHMHTQACFSPDDSILIVADPALFNDDLRRRFPRAGLGNGVPCTLCSIIDAKVGEVAADDRVFGCFLIPSLIRSIKYGENGEIQALEQEGNSFPPGIFGFLSRIFGFRRGQILYKTTPVDNSNYVKEEWQENNFSIKPESHSNWNPKKMVAPLIVVGVIGFLVWKAKEIKEIWSKINKSKRRRARLLAKAKEKLAQRKAAKESQNVQ